MKLLGSFASIFGQTEMKNQVNIIVKTILAIRVLAMEK